MVCQNVQKSLKDTVLSSWWVLPNLNPFLPWMLRIEVGLNCYCVVDSELLPKLVHCYEHQLKRLVWGAEGCGWTPNLNVLWQYVDTHWTSIQAYVPVILSATETSCFLLLLFTLQQFFVQHSLYVQNIWNCTNASLYSRHIASLLYLPTAFATLQQILTRIF